MDVWVYFTLVCVDQSHTSISEPAPESVNPDIAQIVLGPFVKNVARKWVRFNKFRDNGKTVVFR